MDRRSLTIGELAEAAGLTRRAIRFYVQRGLLPPPEGAGRGSHYEPRHLDQLRAIQQLQREGHALEEIRGLLQDGSAPRRRTLGGEVVGDQGGNGGSAGEALRSAPRTPGHSAEREPRAPQDAEHAGAVPRAWLRTTLCPGVELHFDPTRAALGAADLRALAQLVLHRLGTDPSGAAPGDGPNSTPESDT